VLKPVAPYLVVAGLGPRGRSPDILGEEVMILDVCPAPTTFNRRIFGGRGISKSEEVKGLSERKKVVGERRTT